MAQSDSEGAGTIVAGLGAMAISSDTARPRIDASPQHDFGTLPSYVLIRICRILQSSDDLLRLERASHAFLDAPLPQRARQSEAPREQP